MAHRIFSDIRSNRQLALLTMGRLALIPLVISLLVRHRQVPAVAVLAVFLVIDYLDGVLARRRMADGPARRTLDSLSDHIAIWCVYAAMAALSYATLPLVGILAARDIYCAVRCRAILRERYVAIGADLPYRGLNALLAIWVMAAPSVSSTVRTSWLAAIALLSLLVAFDLRRATARVATMPMTVACEVISAGALRSLGAAQPSPMPVRTSSRSDLASVA